MANLPPVELFEQILKHRLTIDELTEALSVPSDTSSRTSDVSDTLANANPASLKANLDNYKKFFTKLRFSYVEQMMKERFLAMITEDPPVVVDAKQNYELVEKLKVAKGELQQRKRKTEELLAQLEALSKQIAPGMLAILTTLLHRLLTLARSIRRSDKENGASKKATGGNHTA